MHKVIVGLTALTPSVDFWRNSDGSFCLGLRRYFKCRPGGLQRLLRISVAVVPGCLGGYGQHDRQVRRLNHLGHMSRPRLIQIHLRRDDASLPGIIFSLFHFCRGVANLCSGPVSSAILLSRGFQGGSVGSWKQRGDNAWGALLVYTVACLVVGSCIGVSYRRSANV